MYRDFLAGAVLLMVGSVAAQAQESADPQAGHAVARRICAECHAVEKEPSASPHMGAPTFSAIAAVPGMTTAALLAAIQTSHRERTMPNLILPPDDLRNVVAYIISLQQ